MSTIRKRSTLWVGWVKVYWCHLLFREWQWVIQRLGQAIWLRQGGTGPEMMHLHTKFSSKVKWLRRCHRDKHTGFELSFWPWCWRDLPLNTLDFMMMQCHTKFGCKRIRHSAEMEQSFFLYDNVNLHCDLDLEDSNPHFLHATLAYDNVIPHKVWSKKKFNSSEDIEHSYCLRSWTLAVRFKLKAAIQYFTNIFQWCPSSR